MTGKIIKGIAGFYYVMTQEAGLFECKAKGIFRKEGRKPLVGDLVEIEILDEEEKTGNLTDILPRTNELIRPAVANVDQAMVIFAAEHPKPNFTLLNNFLVMMETQGVSSIIVFNKSDLMTPEEEGELHRIYEGAGYRVLTISVRENKGVDDVRKLIEGRTTVVAGPSGVGKSSLTNALWGSELMETGDISKKLNRGKHTTRHSEVIAVAKDTWFIDTPGFSSLDLPTMEKEELRLYYPEFAPYEGGCRFDGCTHTREPGCAVKAALEEGKLEPKRYQGYLDGFEELKSRRKY